MILYIQPIFIPSEDRYSINEESILSLKNYLETYPYDIKIIMGGWTISDDLWNKIENSIRSNLGNYVLTIKRFDKNYGKAYVVNDLFNTYKDLNFTYFLTADSDMIFTLETYNMFERLEILPIESEKLLHKPFGVCALNQLVQCCHLSHIYKNKYYYTNQFGKEECLVNADHANGIAGGALLFSKDAWIKIGGYRVYGVYAGDDAYALIDIDNIGYSYQMVDSIAMIHPLEMNMDYNAWKHLVCHRDSFSSAYNNIDILETKITEADEFWKNKK